MEARGRACGGAAPERTWKGRAACRSNDAVERAQLQLKTTVWANMARLDDAGEKEARRADPQRVKRAFPNSRDIHVQKNKRALPNSREEARAKECQEQSHLQARKQQSQLQARKEQSQQQA